MGIDGESGALEPGRLAEAAPAECHEFYVTLAVSVAAGAASQSTIEQVLAAGAKSASVLTNSRSVLLVEYLRKAPSHVAAIAAGLSEITAAFPDAEWLDVNDPYTVWRGLVDAESGQPPTDLQAQRYIRAVPPPRSPTPEEVREQREEEECARLDAVEASGALGAIDGSDPEHSNCPDAEPELVLATVIEVLPGFQLAHVISNDRRLFGLTPSTLGIADFDAIQIHQIYRCRVSRKFNRVLWAQKI